MADIQTGEPGATVPSRVAAGNKKGAAHAPVPHRYTVAGTARAWDPGNRPETATRTNAKVNGSPGQLNNSGQLQWSHWISE